jgi:ATP-binding cassette subfamily B protein
MRFDYGYSEEDHLGKPYDFRLLRRLWPFLRQYRRLLIGSVFLVVAITVLDLAMPYFTKIAIDRHIVPVRSIVSAVGPTEDGRRQRYLTVDLNDPDSRRVVNQYANLFETAQGATRIAVKDLTRLSPDDRALLRKGDLQVLGWMVLVFLGVVGMDFFFTFLQKVIMEYAGHKVMHDLRLRLYEHIQRQSMAFFTQQPVARLVTRLTNDVQNMHELFTTFIALVFKDIFLLLGISVVLVLIDWRLALAGFSVLPVVAVAAGWFSSRARDVFRAQRVKVAEINTRMSETIDGIKTLQTFCREDDNYDHFAELNAHNYRLGMRQIHVYALFMPVIEMLGIVAVAILICAGGLHVLDERISLGDLVAALSYMRMFFRPLRDLAENYNILQNAMASAERIFALLDTDRALVQPASSEPVHATATKSAGLLELETVSFAYNPQEPVLRDVSFRVRHGQTVALVGPTGAGKTSILNLILRLYDPVGGQIRLDGKALPLWDSDRLRSRMALVPQEPMLFSGTLRQNIFADPAAVTEEKAEQVVAAANCAELVAGLPGGLNTLLAKGGAGLSSGERQLVAIARAFARDPDILLLDEATSHIDSHTEAAIHQALGNLMRGRTCILVAHRLSTARLADHIVVIKSGAVEEEGSHSALMAAKGFYWHLNRQSSRTHAG